MTLLPAGERRRQNPEPVSSWFGNAPDIHMNFVALYYLLGEEQVMELK